MIDNATSDSPVRIGVVLATVRLAQRGERWAGWLGGALALRAGVTVEQLDLRDYPLPAAEAQMPITSRKRFHVECVRRWREAVLRLDGYVILTPEFIEGYPGRLKNALAHVPQGWRHKPVAFVSYRGVAAGWRAVEQLRRMAGHYGMVVCGDVDEAALREPTLSRAHAEDAPATVVDVMLDELLWWARTTKLGREAGRNPALEQAS